MRLILSAILVLGLATALSAQEPSGTETSKALSGFNDLKPVFKLKEEQLSNKNRFMRYSVLTGYREGVSPINGQFNANFKAQLDTVQGTHRIKMYNLSIQDMLTHDIVFNGYSAEVVLEVKNPSKYQYEPQYGDQKEWLRKNGYCFELMMPIGVIKSMDMVNDEICRLFRITYTREKRTADGRQKDVFVIREL
jgi:hypothetical protein